MPTPTYVSAASTIKGVTSTETGINISGFTQSFTDEKLLLENKHGSPVGFVHNFLVSSTCTITGEVNTALNAVLGVAFGVAETITNAITGGSGYSNFAGGFYMDDIEIAQERGGWATATINFTKHPDIT
jgi:hypothetical protein